MGMLNRYGRRHGYGIRSLGSRTIGNYVYFRFTGKNSGGEIYKVLMGIGHKEEMEKNIEEAKKSKKRNNRILFTQRHWIKLLTDALNDSASKKYLYSLLMTDLVYGDQRQVLNNYYSFDGLIKEQIKDIRQDMQFNIDESKRETKFLELVDGLDGQIEDIYSINLDAISCAELLESAEVAGIIEVLFVE